MDLTKLEWEVLDWIQLSQERDQWWNLVNIVMKIWIP